MNTPTLRSYSRVIAAITYDRPWLARTEVATLTDNLGAVDSYNEQEGPATERDDGSPITVRCPASAPCTVREIHVVYA